MKILVCGNTSAPFENEFQIHYSIYKSFGAATGFSELGHEVYYLSKNREDKIENIKLIPYQKINKEILLNFDIIIFGLEVAIPKIFKTIEDLNIFIDKKNNFGPKIIIKQTSHKWFEKSGWSFSQVYNSFDYFFCQEKEYCLKMKKENGDPQNKVYYSNMAVPSLLPPIGESPYYAFNNYNLIYMGRLMHSPSKMPFLKNLMNELGDKYILNILPGSFAKPKGLVDRLNLNGINKFGSDSIENLNWLINYFSDCKNIKIHKPVKWGEHWNYLYHADVGIDLSPSWSDKKSDPGNAKLLEYLASGLPVVTEVSTGNIHLVKDSKGGIIVNNICNTKEYSLAIKNIINSKYNRFLISNITIKNNSWKKRAKEILDIINK